MDSLDSKEHISYKKSFQVVQRNLIGILDNNQSLKESIEKSLAYTVAKAETELKDRLLNGLFMEFNQKGWPKTIKQWAGIRENGSLALTKDGAPDCFLWEFATWYPNENGKEWMGEKYNEKLYYVICHFYWLISGDQDEENLPPPQKFKEFNNWLVTFIQVNEVFLDHEDSLEKFKDGHTWDEICTDPELLNSPQYRGYDLAKFKDSRNSWKTFNQFFYRRFNGANHRNGGIPPDSKLIKIHSPDDNRVITSPACCTFKAHYQIGKDGTIKKIKTFYDEEPKIKKIKKCNDDDLKNSLFKLSHKNAKAGQKAEVFTKGHPVANISDLILFNSHFDDFYGGTFIHYFLSPYDYHRYHLPVTGRVVQAKQIPGTAFMDVVMKECGHESHAQEPGKEFDAPDDDRNGYEFIQSRGLVVIDTKYYLDDDNQMQEYADDDHNNIGKVAVIPVGMAQVSGVGINESLEGEVVPKGWEFGRFKFGGSDIILLFDKRAKLSFNYQDDHDSHYKFGETIGYVLQSNPK